MWESVAEAASRVLRVSIVAQALPMDTGTDRTVSSLSEKGVRPSPVYKFRLKLTRFPEASAPFFRQAISTNMPAAPHTSAKPQ